MPDALARTELDAVDRRLIVATQAGLPRVSRPYDAIGGELGLAGGEVIPPPRAAGSAPRAMRPSPACGACSITA